MLLILLLKRLFARERLLLNNLKKKEPFFLTGHSVKLNKLQELIICKERNYYEHYFRPQAS